MKPLFMSVAVLALLLSPARGAEVSVKLDDAAQNALLQLPPLLEQCVAGVMVRGDAAVCRSVSQLLGALGAVVKTAQADAAKAAEADKAKATDK